MIVDYNQLVHDVPQLNKCMGKLVEATAEAINTDSEVIKPIIKELQDCMMHVQVLIEDLQDVMLEMEKRNDS